jgi:hypothetical protein
VEISNKSPGVCYKSVTNRGSGDKQGYPKNVEISTGSPTVSKNGLPGEELQGRGVELLMSWSGLRATSRVHNQKNCLDALTPPGQKISENRGHPPRVIASYFGRNHYGFRQFFLNRTH